MRVKQEVQKLISDYEKRLKEYYDKQPILLEQKEFENFQYSQAEICDMEIVVTCLKRAEKTIHEYQYVRDLIRKENELSK